MNLENLAREPFAVCGQSIAAEIFKRLDSDISYIPLKKDGERVKENEVFAKITGSFREILTAERTALNFLQRLSGIATLSSEAASIISDLKVKVVDTRKTTPGWRLLEKYAVKTGGASNHRIGLFDAVLIKNNHIDAIGGKVTQAINACRNVSPEGTFIQVEVRDFKELESALSVNPDCILLDNMSTEKMVKAVEIRNTHNKNILLEASGGITVKNLREVAETGVERISMGSITHSASAVDISLRFSD